MPFGEAFLEYPDLFPARQSGATCGPVDLVIDFAGGPYCFEGLSPGQEAVVRSRFGTLCNDKCDAPAVVARVLQAPRSDFRPVDLRGREYTFDIEAEPTHVRAAGLDFMARLDWSPTLAGTLWTCIDTGRAFEGVFENFFRLLVAYQLLESGGVLLHSAAVVDGESALLFFGPSGAGKTTISRLAVASRRCVLSDDLNAVTFAAGVPTVHQVPFAGELGQTAHAGPSRLLRSAHRLRHGDRVDTARLSTAVAIASLITCAPFVNTDACRLDRLMETIEAIVRSVPVRTLTFLRETPFDVIVASLESVR